MSLYAAVRFKGIVKKELREILSQSPWRESGGNLRIRFCVILEKPA